MNVLFSIHQVKVWFQNRRTKYKRVQSDDGTEEGGPEDDEPIESDCEDIDVDSPPSPSDMFHMHAMNSASGDIDSDEERHLAAVHMQRLQGAHENGTSHYGIMTSQGYLTPDMGSAPAHKDGLRFDSISKMVPWAHHLSDNRKDAEIKSQTKSDSHTSTNPSHSQTSNDPIKRPSSSIRHSPYQIPDRIVNKRPWESTVTKNNNMSANSYSSPHDTMSPSS